MNIFILVIVQYTVHFNYLIKNFFQKKKKPNKQKNKTRQGNKITLLKLSSMVVLFYPFCGYSTLMPGKCSITEHVNSQQRPESHKRKGKLLLAYVRGNHKGCCVTIREGQWSGANRIESIENLAPGSQGMYTLLWNMEIIHIITSSVNNCSVLEFFVCLCL